jgi:hypothetical protein
MLYKTKLSFWIVVDAENELIADELVRDNAKEELDSFLLRCPNLKFSKVGKLTDIPADWSEAIPWGNEDDQRVGQIVRGEGQNDGRTPCG